MKLSLHYCLLTIIGVAVTTFFQACQNEDYLLPQHQTRQTSQNSTIRTTEEAIKIATEAYTSHFGPFTTSRNSTDTSPSVSVIGTKAPSRTQAESDTCIFVVNFHDNAGFALIAANRNLSPILGISDTGNYNPDSSIHNPGIEYYIGRAIEYLRDKGGTASPMDGIIISGPNDPKPIQVKEWEDTTYFLHIPQRINNAWSPGFTYNDTINGSLTLSTLSTNPTGYYFSKYWCGEAVISIAHALLYFSKPQVIPPTVHKKDFSAKSTSSFSPDWEKMKRHRQYLSSGNVKECDRLSPCNPTDNNATHEQIALLCRAIGNLTECTYYGTQKQPIMVCELQTMFDAVSTLGLHIQPWTVFEDGTTLKDDMHPTWKTLLLLNGMSPTDIKALSHFWIIDGEKIFTARHHYATREYGGIWKEIITDTYSKEMFHINWSQGGNGDGWYDKGPFSPKYTTDKYLNPQFTRISFPSE